jgi:phenylalanyl-tRNA synthetase beta chain
MLRFLLETEDYKLQNIVATQLNSQGFNEMMANSLTTASYVNSDALKEEHRDYAESLE